MTDFVWLRFVRKMIPLSRYSALRSWRAHLFSDELYEDRLLADAHDDDLVAVAGDGEIARVVKNNHGTRVLVDRVRVRDLFNKNVKHLTHGQVDRLGVHQIAAEEHFDPVAVFGHGENDAGGVLDGGDHFFAAGQLDWFSVGAFSGVFISLDALCGFARSRLFPGHGFPRASCT